MNLLIFARDELSEFGCLRIVGERARHLRDILKLKVHDSLRVGEIAGGVGLASVVEVSPECILLRVGQLVVRELPKAFDLIVALPRPQSLKKVLEISAALGVGRICFIGSKRVEKSYFQSSILDVSNLEHHLRLGLEQGVSTRLPEITVCRSFAVFFKEVLELHFSDVKVRLLAHPNAEFNLLTGGFLDRFRSEDPVVLAIGPEGGWQDDELLCFEQYGFKKFHAGQQILRVETSISFIAGQLELIRTISTNGVRLEHD